MLPPELRLENPLWDYALSVYPKLAEPLLQLQAQGARVNQLLAALWCSASDRRWPGAVDSAIENWHQTQVLPIRERRMALKSELEQHPQLQQLYQAYKTVELNLERVELAMLCDWIEQTAASEQTEVAHNIDAVLRLNQVDLQTPQRQKLLDLVETL